MVTTTVDGLHDLRQACRDALNATPKEDWCDGKTPDEIIAEMVCKILNPVETFGGATINTEVYDWKMGRETINLIIRLPRATNMNIQKPSVDLLAAFGK